MSAFANRILRWFDLYGRKNLPWQVNPSPYRVWVSEIMLQQTQVTTVIPYFEKFMGEFPDVQALATAPLDKVLHLWTGLGYYARARNLHQAAGELVARHNGRFPDSVEGLMSLPGIGRSTAGAIVALAFGKPAPILDGNVKRVLTRFHAIDGWPEAGPVNRKLWEIAAESLPLHRHADYTQAMMDLGATVCTRSRPACATCPLANDCQALADDSISRYPGRKPGRQLPVREVTMHILQNERGEILLQRRPPTGIWGGLWSLPESPANAPPAAALPVTLHNPSRRVLPAFRHSFTHYHLDITPVYYRVSPRDALADSSPHLWYSLASPPTVGLAAPVLRLLAGLATAQSNG